MKIVRSKYLPPLRRHAAINLLGILFVHPNVILTKRLLNHEAIHTAQMRELGYLPFYLLYVLEWLVRYFLPGRAYRSISFEREAYAHEGSLRYLGRRRHYACFKFLFRKNLQKRK